MCRQHATGKRGLYRTLLVEQRPMSLARDFRPQAVEDESLPPAKETPEEVERRFWRNVNLRPPLYGADVPGSLFDEDLKVQLPAYSTDAGAACDSTDDLSFAETRYHAGDSTRQQA